LSFQRRQDELEISGALPEATQLRREVFYALYREKIYMETLPMREALVQAVTAE
jgi:hypothetical protein